MTKQVPIKHLRLGPGPEIGSHHAGKALDCVETHLLSEIASRSDHFFEAAGVIADLRNSMGKLHACVHGLRYQVRLSSVTSTEVHCTG